MPQCVFKSCKNNSRYKNVSTGISYFRFPGDPFLCEIWISIVAEERQEDFFRPTKTSVVCSIHFEKSEIIGNSQRSRLSKTAVPKIQKLPLSEKETASVSKIEPVISFHPTSQNDVIKEVQVTSEMVTLPSSPTVSVSDLISVCESPRNMILRRKLDSARQIIIDKSKKINNLQKVNKRLNKKVNSLKNIIQLLKKQ